MGTYGDSMTIVFYIVMTVAGVGLFLALGVAVEALVHHVPTRSPRPASPPTFPRFAH
jgi:hypothetical protein